MNFLQFKLADGLRPGPATFLEFLSCANCFHVVHDNTGTFNQIFIMRELNDGPVTLCGSSEWRIASLKNWKGRQR